MMCRNFLPLVILVVFCAIGPASVVAQTDRNSGSTGSASGASDSAASVTGEAPRMLTGEELRASVQPGQVIGAGGDGAGALRGAADATSAQTGRTATNRQTGRNNNALRNIMNNFGMFNSMYNQRRQIRIPIALGFAPTTLPTSPVVAARAQDRLTRIPQLRDRANVSIQMDGPVAVLQGEVVSSHERELVARLILLEPGISDVRNELQVTQTEATQ